MKKVSIMDKLPEEGEPDYAKLSYQNLSIEDQDSGDSGVQLRQISTEQVLIKNYVDSQRRALYYICVVVIFLSAAVIVLMLIAPSRDSLSYDLTLLEGGSRIQLRANTFHERDRLFVRTENTFSMNLVMTERIPWLQGSSFDVVAVDSECFALRSMNGKYLRIDSSELDSSKKRSRVDGDELQVIKANGERVYDATKFVAVTVASPILQSSSSEDKDGQPSTAPTTAPSAPAIRLKQCRKNVWLDVSLLDYNKFTGINVNGDKSDDAASNSVLTLTTRQIIAEPSLVAPTNAPTNATAEEYSEVISFELLHSPRVYGVNLGGWFIPEVWMCPSFFNGTGLGWGGSVCAMVNYSRPLTEQRMQRNLDEWIREEDFREISALGYNSVRLPVGHWNILQDLSGRFEPRDVKRSLRYVDWTFDMAEKYGLSVTLDLHGAPGSQNGYDHSGCQMRPQWTDPRNVQLTLDVIEAMAARYGQRPSLFGIELMNEPSQFYSERNHTVLAAFYEQAYHIVRRHSPSAHVIFNELYQNCYHSWNKLLREPQFYNVIVDWHLYEWPMRALSVPQHLLNAKAWAQLVEDNLAYHPIVVGEWSMSTGPHQAGQPFVDASVRSYRDTVGWYLWNWKVERGAGFDEWDVQFNSHKAGGLDPIKALAAVRQAR